MCGICGMTGSLGPERIGGMLSRLSPRGPDAEGRQTFSRPGQLVTLGHRRLKIIDLSDNANQPFCDPSGRAALVFNGEIYNYPELRTALEARGCQFRTQSDTEVLLQGFLVEGTDFFRKLNGIFAFVIKDLRDGRLILARDPLGIKPLYWTRLPGGEFAFASELKALLTLPELSRCVNPAAIASYLTWLSIPEPLTMIEGVETLAPGHWGLWDGKQFSIRPFAPSWETLAALPETTQEEIDATLRRLIRRQTLSDVPVGLFLSAGIDSGVLAALLTETMGPEKVRAFTVRFEEASYDEATLAGQVAAKLGLHHETLTVRAQDVLQNLDDVIDALDQPSADGVNTYFISKAVKGAGVSVALSGL